MLKRNFKVMAALAVAVSLSTGGIAIHASALPDKTPASQTESAAHKKGVKHHHGFGYKVLKDKLGFTDAQIKDAANSQKTAFDLAGTKGVTADQLRKMIVDSQSQKIDQMVSEGKITQDKAKTIKADLQEKVKNWDGKLGFKNKGDKAK